jgi:hypothetical protein
MHRMPRLARYLAAALLLLPLLASCGGGGSKSTTSPGLPDAIIIASISPAQGTKLPPGGMVNFQVTCNYRLVSAAAGVVTFSVTDGLGNVLSNSTTNANVLQGEASLQFAGTVTIPANIVTVKVGCQLAPNSSNSDIIAAGVTFTVGT